MSAARQFDQSAGRYFVQSQGRQRNRASALGVETVTAVVPFVGLLPFQYNGEELQLTRYLRQVSRYDVTGTDENGNRHTIFIQSDYRVNQQTLCSSIVYSDSCLGVLPGDVFPYPDPSNFCYPWWVCSAPGGGGCSTWPRVTTVRTPTLIQREYHDDLTDIVQTTRLFEENHIEDAEIVADSLLSLISSYGPYNGCFDANNTGPIYFGLDVPAAIAARPPLGSEVTRHLLLTPQCAGGLGCPSGVYLWPTTDPGLVAQRLWYGGNSGLYAGRYPNQNLEVIKTKGRTRTSAPIPCALKTRYRVLEQVFDSPNQRQCLVGQQPAGVRVWLPPGNGVINPGLNYQEIHQTMSAAICARFGCT